MASSKDAVTSDTEGHEKPVRQQLQKASISKASGEGMENSIRPEETASDQPDQAEPSDLPENPSQPRSAPQDLRKKRSFEEIEGDTTDERSTAHTRSGHTRKRSRDSTAEEDELNNGRKISGERKRDVTETEGAPQFNGAPQAPVSDRPGTPEATSGKRGEEKVEAMTSPKTKRSRLHPATAEEAAGAKLALGEETDDAVPDIALDEPPAAEPRKEEGTKADVKDSPDTTSSTVPPGSGFANTSATSPFGAVASHKSAADQPQTSASAFAASGFGSLSAAATSGFGTLGKTSGGPAGGWSSKSATGSETQNGTEKTGGTFGGALGQTSGFGASTGGSTFGSSGASAFGGKLGSGGTFGGSGFGSLGSGAGLSSFASGKASPFALGNTKPGRPFGAAIDEDEDDETGGGGGGEEDDASQSGLKSPLSQTSDKQDERFYVQDHETGEEGEVTEYSCRAKLYNFAVVDAEKGKKEWKERGLGTLRLNTARPASEGEGDKAAARSKARLVMRADGSQRLVLNTPVQKDIKFGAASGGPPQGGLVLFMGAVDGKKTLEMLQLKIRQQFALELYDKIKELQEAM